MTPTNKLLKSLLYKVGHIFKCSWTFFFQPDWCSDVRSWYAKNSTDCSACVRCRSRVFLGIFVFLPSLIQFTPAVRQNTLNLFSHLFKFCFSWTLLTLWLPTYFCKFVSYCPIKFGKVEWSKLTMSSFSVWKIIFSLRPCLQNRISQYLVIFNMLLHSTFNDYSTTLFVFVFLHHIMMEVEVFAQPSVLGSLYRLSSLYDPTCDGREDFYSGLSRGLKIMFTLRQFFHKPWNWIMKEYIYRFCKTIILER